MGAAQDQGVGTRFPDRAEIVFQHQPGDLVVKVDVAVFHQRHQQGTALTHRVDIRVDGLQRPNKGAAADGGIGADDAHRFVAGGSSCCPGSGLDHTGVGHGEPVGEGGIDHRAGSAAGGNDEFYPPVPEKAQILRGIAVDDLPAAGAVGNPAHIAKVDDVLAGEQTAQLPHHRKATHTGVKDANGPLIHGKAPFHLITRLRLPG